MEREAAVAASEVEIGAGSVEATEAVVEVDLEVAVEAAASEVETEVVVAVAEAAQEEVAEPPAVAVVASVPEPRSLWSPMSASQASSSNAARTTFFSPRTRPLENQFTTRSVSRLR